MDKSVLINKKNILIFVRAMGLGSLIGGIVMAITLIALLPYIAISQIHNLILYTAGFILTGIISVYITNDFAGEFISALE